MNFDPKDIDAINQMLKKLDEPHQDAPCQCPTCRYMRGDLPPFTDEDIKLLNIAINDILAGVRIQAPVKTKALTALVERIIRLMKTAYAAGVDNARREAINNEDEASPPSPPEGGA